jgi:hypothetical protein
MRDELTARLIELTRNWNPMDDVPKSDQKKAKEIGIELWEAGGIHMMQDAFYEAKGRNKTAGALAAYWHGIGSWQW